MKQHVEGLHQGLRDYFPEQDGSFEWIRDPFNVSTQTVANNLSNAEEEQLLELAADDFSKLKFHQNTLPSFWLRMHSEYPSVSQKAVKYLLPFPTSYLCEVAFSALVGIKHKIRNRLIDVEPHLRLKVTNLEPDIHELVSGHKQYHPSH